MGCATRNPSDDEKPFTAPGGRNLDAMAMRAIWKGAISFGLVNIPISLYSATRTEDLKFRLLREGDLSPVNYKRVAGADGKEVPWEKIVKGYEYEKGKFVVLKEEDFKRVDIEATQTVDIERFVNLEEVNPIFFNKPYYMEPLKGRGQSVCPAPRGAAGQRQNRHREGRHQDPAASCRREAAGRRAHARTHALRDGVARRGGVQAPREGGGGKERDANGQGTHRLDVGRVEAGGLRRRLSRRAGEGDRGEDRIREM